MARGEKSLPPIIVAPGSHPHGQNPETLVFSTLSQALIETKRMLETDGFPLPIIKIAPGTYREKIIIDFPVILSSLTKEQPIIYFDDSGATPDPLAPGKALGTWGCASLTITSSKVELHNLRIENRFNYQIDSPSSQGVALMTNPGADQILIHGCTIYGQQDTLLLDGERILITDSTIFGHVDFICGSSTAFFDRCTLVSLSREGKNPSGYIIAPSTAPESPYGFVFWHCKFEKADPEMAEGSVRLGRPWHPHGDTSRNPAAAFVSCRFDEHLAGSGYAPLSARDSAGKTVWFQVTANSRFIEIDCTGPGSVISEDRRRVNSGFKTYYTRQLVLAGWTGAV